MIAKVTGRGHSFKGATAYYMNDKKAQSSERVAWTLTGNMPTRDPNKAYKWMAYTAGEAERLKAEAGVKNTGRKAERGEVYTFTLAGHPDDKGKYDQLHWEAQVLAALKMQGLDGHQWYAVGHNDTDHDHAHVVVNLVNHYDGRLADLSDNHKKLQAWALQYSREYEQGKDYTPQREANAQKREKGERTKYQEQPLREKSTIRQLYEYSDSGKAFAAALKEEGLTLANGERRGLVVVNEQGKAYSLTRQLDKQSRKDVRKKLGDLSELPQSREVQKERAAAWEKIQGRKDHFNEQSQTMKQEQEAAPQKEGQAEIWSREDYHVEQNRRDTEARPEPGDTSQKESQKRRERDDQTPNNHKGRKIVAPYQNAGEREDIGRTKDGRILTAEEVRRREEDRRRKSEDLDKEAAKIADPAKRKEFIAAQLQQWEQSRYFESAERRRETTPDVGQDFKNPSGKSPGDPKREAAELRAEEVIKNRNNPYLLTPEQKEAIKQRDKAQARLDYNKDIDPYDTKHLDRVDRLRALEAQENEQRLRQVATLKEFYKISEHQARIQELTAQYNEASGRKAEQLQQQLDAERKTYENAQMLITYQQSQLRMQQAENRPEWAKEQPPVQEKPPTHEERQRSENKEAWEKSRAEQQRAKSTEQDNSPARDIDAENARYINERLRGGQDRERGYEP